MSCQQISLPLAAIQKKQVDHLRSFSDVIARLLALSNKELARECFTDEDELFVRNLMQNVDWQRAGSGGGPPKYNGWYPLLFYRAIHWSEWDFNETYGAGGYDALVADVHTDVLCGDCPQPDPGSVLHEAVGRVNLLMIAVDNGHDRFICAGPVLSHYEFEVTGSPRRISDSEWRIGGGNGGGPFGGGPTTPPVLDGGSPPDVDRSRIEGVAPPRWTRGYLVPR